MLPALTTTAQLRAEGLDRTAIRGLVRSGKLRPVRRGVFAHGSRLTGPRADLIELCLAAQLVLPVGTLICGPTAAILHRYTADRPGVTDIHALLPPGFRKDRIAGVRTHVGRPAQTWMVDGVACTDRVRTVLDTAASLPREQAVAIIDAACIDNPARLEDLRILASLQPPLPRRGRRRVARHLDLATAGSESALETLAMLLWRDGGLPRPEQQAVIEIAGRFIARVDFLWEAAMLVVEVDGLGKYAEPGELQQEKARQNALIAAGYTVLRFTWADVVHRPEATLAQVVHALQVAAA